MAAVPPGLATALHDRYRLDRELGQGGMATVYLAHDLRNNRKVALKVLRPELAAILGAARFLKEIETTANLQHPHILPLFDSGQAESFLFYVMPFIEGESLRDRLSREKQLPIPDALRIATEIASALDYAHRHGVLHRDIKPENILLHDGQAVVADFGIALALEQAGGTRLTETGLSLGTPQYMSPEQAMGERHLDARSDVFSLGCVLYEMLAGEPAFGGPTARAIVAKVMTAEPGPLSELRRTVPPAVEAAVARALQKLPADRWSTAGKFAGALLGGAASEDAVVLHSRSGLRRVPVWAAALGGVCLATITLLLVDLSRRHAAWSDPPVRQWNLALPDSAPVALAGPTPIGVWRRAVAISRQGDAVPYVAPHGLTTQLYVRRLDEQEVHALPGTDGAFHPFFSPDGRWVAFFSGTELRKAPVTGGTPVTLTGVQDPVGAEWMTRDSLFVADKEGLSLIWVPAGGGTPQPAAPPHGWGINAATVLPGHQYAIGSASRGILLAISLTTGRVSALTSHGLVAPGSVDPGDIIRGASPRYLSSGHLLFLTPGDGVLAAMPFDPARMRVLGPPMPLVNGVREEATYKAGQFDISEDGTLVYAPGHNANLGLLAWATGSGRLDTLPYPRSSYFALSVAPGGAHAIVSRLSELGHFEEPILLDLTRNQESRPSEHSRLADMWTDRTHILRCCVADTVPELYDLNTQAIRPLSAVKYQVWAVSPDGKWLYESYEKAGQDIGVIVPAWDSTNTPQTLGPGDWAASFSPDSRWLAFNQYEGAPRIVVVHVPFDGRRFEIAADGGDEPRWFPDGRRIVYKRGTQFMVIDVTTRGDSLVTSLPRPWLSGPFYRVDNWAYDVGPDGRLLVIVGPAETSAGHLNVVTGFEAMVRRVSQSGETPKR